jgi:hypothetical protein
MKPDPKYNFTTHQVGRMETRPEDIPIWDGKQLVGYRKGSLVSVFRLMGWGATPEIADSMAARAK